MKKIENCKWGPTVIYFELVGYPLQLKRAPLVSKVIDITNDIDAHFEIL